MDKCLVIGGGIAGLCVSRALARRGARVTLLEAARIGAGASRVAGGMLSSMRPWAESVEAARISRQAAAAYPEFARELLDETGIDIEYTRSGLLLLDPQDIEGMCTWRGKGAASHVRVCPGDAQRHGTDGQQAWPEGCFAETALFSPDIAQARVPRILQALSASLRGLGVALREWSPVKRVEFSGRRFVAALLGDGRIEADCVVLCSGVWLGGLLPAGMGDALRIEPVRGQMVCMKFPQLPFSAILLDGGRYMIPRRDGHVLLGSTMERVGLDSGTTAQAEEDLMAWALSRWSGFGDGKKVWHRAGLRPASAQGLPVVCRLPGKENAFIHAGHYRKGILQAPWTAERLAEDIMAGQA